MKPQLFDAHCHLSLMARPDVVAREAATLNLGLFDCGTDPRDFESAKKCASQYPNIVAGVGLHPWWIADGRCRDADVELLCDIAARERFIGEVGLDFSPRFAESAETQTAAFAKLCGALADSPVAGRVISIHAVRSADTVLNILENNGLLKADPGSPSIIFHWFNGTSDVFVRARNAGCFFSVNERMLATKRGREYARQIPEGQLLLETDYPCSQGNGCSANDMQTSLERTLRLLAEMCQTDLLPLAEATTTNTKSLFNL